MKKTTLTLLTIMVASSAMAQKSKQNLTATEHQAIQRARDSSVICVDRAQLRADMQYRDQLLADSAALRRLPPAEIRYLTDTAVTESRKLLHYQEQWFQRTYGVPCTGVDEAYKQ